MEKKRELMRAKLAIGGLMLSLALVFAGCAGIGSEMAGKTVVPAKTEEGISSQPSVGASGASRVSGATTAEQESSPVAPSTAAHSDETASTTQSVNTVKLVGSAHTVVLPVIGIPAQLGLQSSKPLSLLPTQPLPDISFEIPPERAQELAIFWLNNGDDVHGSLFLAPKAWKGMHATEGMDGVTQVTLQEDATGKDQNAGQLEYYGSGGCAGCAARSIGIAFPELHTWAEKFVDAPIPVSQQPPNYEASHLDAHTLAYTYKSDGPAQTYGISVEEHEKYAAFHGASVRTSDKSLATLLLNFELQRIRSIKYD